MLIKIIHNYASKVTSTSPLIRQLFKNAIQNDINLCLDEKGFRGAVDFQYIPSDLVLDDRFKVSVVPSRSDRLTNEKVTILHREINDMLEVEYNRVYRAIEKMENLLDVYGVGNPQKIFDASSMDAMDC